MDKREQFYEALQKEMVANLATAAGESVTMRMISPVYYEKKVLLFTNETSRKYLQLAANPHCCIAVGPFYAEARAELLGPTMAPENEALRTAYAAKFPGAFDEGLAFGGRNADFVLLTPTRLTGWAFPDDVPVAGGIPTIPFDIRLD